MPRPWLVAVDEDPDVLHDLQSELRDRYGRHYEVSCLNSSEQALSQLTELAGSGDQVALVLAAQWLSGMTGSELLGEVRRLHPECKRGLLIEWGGWGIPATGKAIFEAMADGRIDQYVLRPLRSPDELFHQAVSGFLLEWTEARRISSNTVHVIGESWSGRAYELRDVLTRCAIPHSFSLADSAGRARAAGRHRHGSQPPGGRLPRRHVLIDPSDVEITEASGSPIGPTRDQFDLVIVGAGPAGLSAAVYGASEGFDTLVIDEGGIGGQATSSALIRNYLGFPARASAAASSPSAPTSRPGSSGRALPSCSELPGCGPTATASSSTCRRAARCAPGRCCWPPAPPTGGWGYRRSRSSTGAGVHYGSPATEAPTVAGQDVFVVGGANSAGQAALHLARYARRVTLLVRGQSLEAGMSHYLVRQVHATGNVEVRLGTEVAGGGGDGWLDHLVLRDCDTGAEETVSADGLFLMIGASPRTDWLPPEVARDSGGFVLTGTDLGEEHGWPLERSPTLLETSVPGLLAAGDVRHGSVGRVAAAVGEGSVAVQTLHGLLAGEQLPAGGRPAACRSCAGPCRSSCSRRTSDSA